MLFFIFKKNRLFFWIKKKSQSPSLDWIHKLQTQSYSHSADWNRWIQLIHPLFLKWVPVDRTVWMHTRVDWSNSFCRPSARSVIKEKQTPSLFQVNSQPAGSHLVFGEFRLSCKRGLVWTRWTRWVEHHVHFNPLFVSLTLCMVCERDHLYTKGIIIVSRIQFISCFSHTKEK